MIGKKLGLKYGVDTIFFPYDAWEKERIEEIKDIILKRLKRREWF